MTLSEKLEKINEIKRKSLQAIQSKGVNLTAADPFEAYPQAIEDIPQEVNIADSSAGGVPDGTIVMWSGPIENIPAGWALCDGQNGTPDLRGRFVLGASEDYPLDDVGGEEEHTLTNGEMPTHSHSSSAWVLTGSGNTDTFGYNSGNKNSAYTSAQSIISAVSGSSQPHNNMPPYYALCFIMKLPTIDLENIYEEGEKLIGSFMGKPLYRNMVVGQTASTSDAHSNLDITLEFAVMVRVGGCFIDNASSASNPFPNNFIEVNIPTSRRPYVRILNVADNSIAGSAFFNRSFLAWFEYTKEPIEVSEDTGS